MERPEGLSSRGTALWEAVTSAYTDLREPEWQALINAARTVDELDLLEAALAGAAVVVEGSQGQPRPHPLFGEVRAHRLALRQMLAAVGLDEADAERHVSEGAARSHAGRQLARKRWERRGAAA